MVVAWATLALVVAVMDRAPLPTEAGAAARFTAVSLRLKVLAPLLVKASIAMAWATVAPVLAVMLPAPLPTEAAAAARLAAVSLRL